jgi:hypothetical protein
MKIRNGFVSNSSSSSFMVLKANLSLEQLDGLMNHSDHPKCDEDEAWSVFEEGNWIVCSVFMDNFDLIEYAIEELFIPEANIKRRGYYES